MAATAASDVSDGPVLSLINKRLRALRKKLNRVLQLEETISQGKTVNKEQEEMLRAKSSLVAVIDELEKLRQPLSSAVSEEISLAVPHHQVSISGDSPSNITDEEIADPKNQSDDASMVEDLLNLMYFGSLFDVKSQSDFTSTMLTRAHERGCCLTYDYVTDDATDLLGERDLDCVSMLSGLLMSRPVDSTFSHKNALQRCVEHAKLWLAKADQPIDPRTDVSYLGLREKLNKIMASDYFTTPPRMKDSVEVAAGNFANFQVPVPIHCEDSDPHFQKTDEVEADFQEHETSDGQQSPVDEVHKTDLEPEIVSEALPVEQEQTMSHTEMEDGQVYVEEDPTEQQYMLRKSYPNQRGGRGGSSGRRGYYNNNNNRGGYYNQRGSRGGGFYQNRRNQYYDQPGNYYQRNYYNNNGGRGGGYPYNNRVSAEYATNNGTSVAS